MLSNSVSDLKYNSIGRCSSKVLFWLFVVLCLSFPPNVGFKFCSLFFFWTFCFLSLFPCHVWLCSVCVCVCGVLAVLSVSNEACGCVVVCGQWCGFSSVTRWGVEHHVRVEVDVGGLQNTHSRAVPVTLSLNAVPCFYLTMSWSVSVSILTPSFSFSSVFYFIFCLVLFCFVLLWCLNSNIFLLFFIILFLFCFVLSCFVLFCCDA